MHFSFSLLALLAGCSTLLHAATYKLDPNFKPDIRGAVETHGGVDHILFGQDGKLIIAGGFSTVDGESRKGISKLHSNGKLDSTFDPGEGIDVGRIHTLLQTPKGILAGGEFNWFNGVTRYSIIRLNMDGSVDESFRFSLGSVAVNFAVYELLPAETGEIWVGGFFTHVDDLVRICFAGFTDDGSLTATNPQLNNGVLAMDYDDQGRVIIAGGFARAGTIPARGVARLFANGNLDTSFDVGTGPDGLVFATAAKGDFVYIGGNFQNVQGITRRGFARLNSHGALDQTFDAELRGEAVLVASIVPLENGEVIIGGYWETAQGKPHPCMVKLRADGSVDDSWNFGELDDGVQFIGFDQDENLYVAGFFSQIAGEERNALARFLPVKLEPVMLSLSRSGENLGLSFPTLNGARYVVQTRSALEKGQWLEASTIAGTGSAVTYSINPASEGALFYRVVIQP